MSYNFFAQYENKVCFTNANGSVCFYVFIKDVLRYIFKTEIDLLIIYYYYY